MTGVQTCALPISLFTELYQTGRKVRLLGVRCSQLVPISLQMSLFDQQVEKLQLYQAMDALNEKLKPILAKEPR